VAERSFEESRLTVRDPAVCRQRTRDIQGVWLGGVRIMNRTSTIAAILLAAVALYSLPSSASADWPVFDHDSARSGVAAGDNAISLANVGTLHRRWVTKFDTTADGAPIYVSSAATRQSTARSLLYQETMDGSTYAVDPFSGAIVWKDTTTGTGITDSMPAEDPSGQWVYAPGIDGFIHKYAALTGAESKGGGFPLRITWSPQIEKDGTSINVANGYLYSATGGYYGDAGQYDGHVVALDLSTGQTGVVNSLCYDIHHLIKLPGTCPQPRSGIWARAGVVVDPDPSMGGRVYAVTGNGKFDANQGGDDYGDTVLAISEDGTTILDSYTPKNYFRLDQGDVDLGSTAPAMLPRQTTSNTPLMAVQGGKDGLLKLLNRQHLGGVGGDLQEYQLGTEILTAPAVWVDRAGATWLYVGTSSALSAFKIVTTSGNSKLVEIWSASEGGTSPIVANGIVFAATSGAVNAFNAINGSLVWSSSQESAGGSIGGVHWESPIVEKGWLYCSDENGDLSAYSL
jgi:outer membrane protein assembly factor BamB